MGILSDTSILSTLIYGLLRAYIVSMNACRLFVSPCAQVQTVPSVSFLTHPCMWCSFAACITKNRYPTPCTRPDDLRRRHVSILIHAVLHIFDDYLMSSVIILILPGTILYHPVNLSFICQC